MEAEPPGEGSPEVEPDPLEVESFRSILDVDCTDFVAEADCDAFAADRAVVALASAALRCRIRPGLCRTASSASSDRLGRVAGRERGQVTAA